MQITMAINILCIDIAHLERLGDQEVLASCVKLKPYNL